MQLQELSRQALVWKRQAEPYAAVIFGDFASRTVATVAVDPDATTLPDDALNAVASAVADPARRRTLLSEDSLCFAGTDAFGASHEHPDPASRALRDMFSLHLDRAAEDPDFPVPMPSYPATSISEALSEPLGFRVKTAGMLSLAQLDNACTKLREFSPELALREWYLTEENSDVWLKFGPAAQINCGWLDGIGVYKHGSVNASLTHWQVRALRSCPRLVPKATQARPPGDVTEVRGGRCVVVVALSVGEWPKFPFSVGECGECADFSEGHAVMKIFDLRKNGRNGIVKRGHFLPFFSHFSPPPRLSHFPQPHPATTLHNPHARHFPFSPPFIPIPPPPVGPHFPHFSNSKILVW